MTRSVYADPQFLSTHADLRLLYRNTAALRLLRMMQAWAEQHLVEPGRGVVWVARDWLCAKLGVGRSQYYRVMRRLCESGWIEPSTVPDSSGRERPGFRVALASGCGFATDMRPSCDSNATQMRLKCDSPPSLLNESNPTEGKAAMASDPRQSSLPGVQFETPVQSQHEPQPGKIGTIRRDPRLREVALRVDEYERARYIQHPRCTRPKRDTPQARDISVEAITRAIERCLPQFETLEQLETRFRAVVELNWEAADRKAETWDWWTGSALWQPNSLDRVLGWLEEKRNWIYLDRAAGKTPLPQRAGDTGNLDHDLLDLSPAEQQAEYNKRHGIDPGSMTISIGGQELHGISDGQFVEITDDEPEPGQWKRWADIPPIKLEIMPLVEGEPSEVVSYPSVAGIQMPAPDPISPELFDGLRLPPPPTDEELRASSQRKLEYMRSTTPEQRAEDAQAGRKPWEVN